MKKNSLIALFLCILTLLPLAACGKPAEGADTTAQPALTTLPAETEPAVTEPDMDHDDLPVLDFQKEKVDFIVRGHDPKFYSEFYSEGITGDNVKDEVYRRELRVEERLNVDVNVVLELTATSNKAHGPWSQISKSITSGDCEYEVAAGSNFNAQANVLKGEYHNLLKVENFNFDKNYWAQEVIDAMRVNDGMFTATGDISTFLYDSLYVIFFNRDLCESYGLKPADVYSTVRNGDWTLDTLIAMTKDVYADADNDNKASEKDVYGFGLMVTSATDGLFSSCDIDIVQPNTDGGLDLAIDIDKLTNVVDKMRTFTWNEKGCCALSELGSAVAADIYLLDKQFVSNQLCFYTDRLYAVSSSLREMSSDYGILPYPKYDQAQENYQTYVHDQFTALAIPMTVTADREPMVAAVLEAMSSDGRINIKPQYYDVALTSKYSRDADSVEMLDIIFRHIKMDIGWIYGNPLSAPATKLMREQIWHNQTTLASLYKSTSKVTQNQLNTLVDNLAKYADQ